MQGGLALLVLHVHVRTCLKQSRDDLRTGSIYERAACSIVQGNPAACILRVHALRIHVHPVCQQALHQAQVLPRDGTLQLLRHGGHIVPNDLRRRRFAGYLGDAQWSSSPCVLRVHVRARLQQGRDDGVTTSTRSNVQGSLALLVLQVYLRPGCQQALDSLQTTIVSRPNVEEFVPVCLACSRSRPLPAKP